MSSYQCRSNGADENGHGAKGAHTPSVDSDPVLQAISYAMLDHVMTVDSGILETVLVILPDGKSHYAAPGGT